MTLPKRKIIEHTTEDGVTIQVTPLHTMTAALLQNKAEQKYPDPLPPRIPAPNAADPGVTIADTDDADYQSALAKNKNVRALYHYTISIDAQITLVNATQDQLIEMYAPVLAQLISTGVELFDDEAWLNTLLHCVFAHPSDQNALNKIRNGTGVLEEVSEEGIAAHVRLFRLVRPGSQNRVRKPTPKSKAQSEGSE